MPETLTQVLALPGLGWLVAAAFIAGTVRGFSGFGTGLVYMPVAAQVLPPFWAILSILVMDIVGPVPNLPSAFRTADRGDLARLVSATAITLPVGLWLLGFVAPGVFAIGVSILALATLVCLMSGLRYRGPVGGRLVLGTGALAGLLGGLTGLPGPPVILLYLASDRPTAVVRAATMAYLFMYDLLVMVIMAVKGALALVPLTVGGVLILPNLAGNVLGAALYRPGHDRLYRGVAYGVIAVSALSGLR